MHFNDHTPLTPAQPDPCASVAAQGRFVRTSDGTVYFVRNTGGKPLKVDGRAFKRIVQRVLGIKRGDSKGLKTAVVEVQDYAEEHSVEAPIESCAAYDEAANSLVVNIGTGCVARVSPTGITPDASFSGGVLFTDEPAFQPLYWADLANHDRPEAPTFPAFRREIIDTLPPTIEGGMTPQELAAVMIAFWIGIFVRDLAPERPILALFGEPKSGKTSVARRLGLAYYGRGYDVSGTASPGRAVKDLAASVANRAFVARDEANDVPDGFMDLLCRTSTGAHFDLSAFYETLGISTFKSKAAVVIAGHRPRWAERADVMSRLLVVRFAKGEPSVITELDRTERALRARTAIWAETLLALRVAVGGGTRAVPITRFADWENIARGVLQQAGLGDAFDSALRKQAAERIAMVVATNPFLALLRAFAEHPGVAETWFTAAQLTDAISGFSGTQLRDKEPHKAVHAVRSPQALSKFLAHIERTGSSVVEVTRRVQKAHGNLFVWNIRPKAC